MRLVFAGTPEFALPSLAAVRAAGHEILAVYTQPDRPAGRGRALRPGPVKQYALAHRLSIAQPPTLKTTEAAAALRGLGPDAMIVVAYGLLLPRAILDIPRHGCINVHASLLPRWRGAAPIQRAIEAGDARTGVTIMQMAEGLDTGDILAAADTPISETDTAASLHERLAALGADALVGALEKLARGALTPVPQDETRATYARKLDKSEARIDWSEPARTLHRRIRAFNPWPVAHTHLAGRTLRLWEVGPVEAHAPVGRAPGTVIAADHAGLRVCTGDGVLTLTRLQIEGGRPLAVGEFLNGHPIAAGERLG